MNKVENLINKLKDPLKEVGLIRTGVKTTVIESFLAQENFALKDILTRLAIPPSTYFAKKKSQKPLDAYSTEKFIRLVSVLLLANDILGKEEAKSWLYRPVPALDKQIPLDLLDTEVGHRLVEQALLQIKYGIYG